MHFVPTGRTFLIAASFAFAAGSATHAETVDEVTVTNGARAVPATVVVPDGEGPFPAVVMNHGHGGGRQENGGFGRIAEELADSGILTISMDFPGSGDSKEPFTEGYLSNMISDSNASLAYILANYEVDADRLGIFGYSMGGRVALTIGASPENPYRAMGLLAPSADWGQEMIDNFMGGHEEFKRLYAEASTDKGYADFTTQWGQHQMLSLTWFDELIASRPLDKISAYEGEMIVIHGGKDVVVPSAINEAVVAAYPAATIVLVPDADHGYGFYSDQPEVSATVEGALADFFANSLK